MKPKLVRDNIPTIISEHSGHNLHGLFEEITDKRELLAYVLKKLDEETKEVKDASVLGNDPDKIVEECADVLEVISKLCRLYDRTLHDVIEVKRKKLEKRGGFNNNIVMY